MRSLIVATMAAGFVSCTGCYGPMYSPPYNYSAPAYPTGGYPGPINTLTPGPQYAPGSPGIQTMPGSSIPYNGTSNAPTYSPPSGGGATRPAPTYGDPSASATQGGQELGYAESSQPVLQRASGIASPLTSIPQGEEAPQFTRPESPPAGNPFGGTASQDSSEDLQEATLNKFPTLSMPATYQSPQPLP